MALSELEILREHEQPAEQPEEHDGHRQRAEVEAAALEIDRVEHRVRHFLLPEIKQDARQSCDDEHAEDCAVCPAVVGAFNHAEHERSDDHDGEQRAERVERVHAVAVARRRHHENRSEQPHEHERDGESEHSAPPEPLQHQPRSERADHAARAGESRPDCDGFGKLAFGEDFREDGKRGGHDEGGGRAHDRPHDDDLIGSRGSRCDARGDAEDQQPGDEGFAPAEVVADGAERQEHACEEKSVGVDNPLEVGA